MNISRIMIAAPASAGGKTSVTIALLGIFKEAGYNPVSVKSGPDYIDPLFHREISGVEAYNLDTYFTNEEVTRQLFMEDAKGHGIVFMEGVMGLYDGVGGVLEEGSSYALAKATDTPIILVINAKGAGRSLAPLIAGMKSFDDANLIRGVILNRISETFYKTVKPVIEAETGIEVLGFLPEKKEAVLSSRHLGLVTPNEVEHLKEITRCLSEELKKNTNIGRITEIADSAPEMVEDAQEPDNQAETESLPLPDAVCTIAVSRDEAFQFFYEENLRLLRNLGAKIVFFSPLHDEAVPKEADALILTGGYPELYLEKLCENRKMMENIQSLSQNGIPIIAECGGFLYLHRIIKDRKGKEYQGVGIIDASCAYTGKSVRFGYVEIHEKKEDFLKEKNSIKGHEFHYYDSENNGSDCVAKKPFDGRSHDCIIKEGNSWMGFPHLYYPSNPEFAKSIILKALEYHERKADDE